MLRMSFYSLAWRQVQRSTTVACMTCTIPSVPVRTPMVANLNSVAKLKNSVKQTKPSGGGARVREKRSRPSQTKMNLYFRFPINMRPRKTNSLRGSSIPEGLVGRLYSSACHISNSSFSCWRKWAIRGFLFTLHVLWLKISRGTALDQQERVFLYL